MATYVALLRAVNVAKTQVAMAELREVLGGMGLTAVRTLLQSGNVIFASGARNAAQLERLMEAEAKRRMALETDFFVRSAAEWKELVASNPFPRQAKADPAHLLVMFLKEAPAAEAVHALQAAVAGRELVRAVGKQAYIVYPDGIGRSRLTGALVEKKLATRGTGRNWNTVLKLAALAG
jgi:uncharacterized protein (DUF1697 family)